MDELREYQGFAEGLAREAGGLLLEMADRGYRLKARRNLVTEADTASERLIAARIRAAWPDHGLLGEEGTRHPGGGRWTWVVDPLDGTTNFLNGLPLFAVSIALLEEGVPVVGAVFVPWPRASRGRVLHARKGGGAWDQ
ncbi:MAG: inositol monophosphatase, partial [Planctomycetes bacterium]|nr:inositol monophosphatase [Planctomycetota bacterium]